jgi:hypothetical protein
MIKTIFVRSSVIARLESGPVGPYLNPLITALRAQRYAPYTIQQYLTTTSGASFSYYVENSDPNRCHTRSEEKIPSAKNSLDSGRRQYYFHSVLTQ